MLVKWQRLTERFKISDRIALFALLIALIPFLDLISRKVTVADIEVLPPIRVNFRTSDLAYKGKIDGEIQRHRDDGTGIVSKEETGDLSTYAILPLSYINRGDAGEDFLVPLEQLQVKIDNQSFMYDAAYTTKMVPRKSPSWIGETSPRLSCRALRWDVPARTKLSLYPLCPAMLMRSLGLSSLKFSRNTGRT